jgi:hypothetical protein
MTVVAAAHTERRSNQILGFEIIENRIEHLGALA